MSASSLYADTYHLVSPTASGVTPSGEMLQTASTANSGFNPTKVITNTLVYWYGPLLTDSYASGNWSLVLWTDNPGCASNITAEIGTTDNDGSNYASLGSQTVDVNSTGLGIHTSAFNYAMPFLNLSNKRLRISLIRSSGCNCTLAYNAGVDFDSRLITTAFGPSGTPTLTPSFSPSPTITPTLEPALIKSVNNASPLLGDTITFTLSYKNPNPNTGANCNDDFEAGTHWPGGWSAPTGGTWGLVADNGPSGAGTQALDAQETGGFHYSILQCASNVTDGSIQSDVKLMAAGGKVTLLWRQNGSSTYQFHIEHGGSANASLRVITNGAFQELAVTSYAIPVGSWFTLRFVVSGFSLEGYINGALVLSATDPNVTYNSGGAGLEIDDPSTAGMHARFDNVIINRDSLAWYNVRITDTLPAGMSYLSSTGGGSAAGQVVSFQLGTLTAQAQGTREIVARVDVCGSPLLNTATLSVGLPAQAFTSNAVTVTASCATATPTFTPTRSSTRTSTRTPTPSATNTATPSSTPSATPSASSTSTRTASPTSSITPSSSSTPSPSATPTATPSRTPSPSSTASASPTSTSTASPSRTASPTATVSPSDTSTSTRTASPTPSFSSSATPSRTASPSPTDTATASSTSTVTPSSTESPSSTASLTPSHTSTATESSTLTPTPSSTGTHTASVTQSSTATASASRTVTVSSTPTPTSTSSSSPTATPTVSPSHSATPSSSATASPSATPTATPSLTQSPSHSATPSASATPTQSATRTASSSATLSPSSSATPSLSPSSTASATASQTPSVTATPSLTLSSSASPSGTFTPSITLSPTASPSPQPMPFQIQARIYNSAGELVRQLYSGAYSGTSLNIQLNQSSMQAGQAGNYLVLDGALSNGSRQLPIDGRNDQGQPLGGGSYLVKWESTDPFGRTQALQMNLVVLPAAPPQQLGIFNSSGELVATVPLPAGLNDLSDFSLSGSSVAVAGQGLGLSLKDSQGNVAPQLWDGRNSQGQAVASGTYMLRAVGGSQQAQGKAWSITVIQSPGLLLEPVLAPNPAPATAGSLLVLVQPQAVPSAILTLHNLAGELVGRATEEANGRIVLPLKGCAGGVYLATIEQRDSQGQLQRWRKKVAILR